MPDTVRWLCTEKGLGKMSQQTMRGEIGLFKTKALFCLVTGQSVALPIGGKEEQSFLTMIIGYSRSPKTGP